MHNWLGVAIPGPVPPQVVFVAKAHPPPCSQSPLPSHPLVPTLETMPPYVRNQPAWFALDATPTRSMNATTLNFGMDHQPMLDALQRAALLTTMAQPSAVTGRNQTVAPSPTEQSSINAQGVKAANMVLSAVCTQRRPAANAL